MSEPHSQPILNAEAAPPVAEAETIDNFELAPESEANLHKKRGLLPVRRTKQKTPNLCCGFEMTQKDKREMDRVDGGAYERRSVNVPIDGVQGEHGGLLEHPEVTFRTSRSNFDVNMYATKKTAANGLLDLALLMANASQLKHIILTEGEHRFYYPMMVLLLVSIILQIVVGLGLLYLARVNISDSSDADVEKIRKSADRLNNWLVAGIFLLTVVNVFISAFGLNEKGPIPRKRS